MPSVSSRAHTISHDHAIEVPTSTQHACKTHVKNNNNFWRNTIENDMREAGACLETLDEENITQHRHNEVVGHLEFDVKIEFTRNAR